jgi:hypothetical protein
VIWVTRTGEGVKVLFEAAPGVRERDELLPGVTAPTRPAASGDRCTTS